MDNHNRFDEHKEPEIMYSRSVKAGKRIYYLDVKKARNNDLYLCITESKRRLTLEDEVPQFEKHKIFIYKEDFKHFTDSLNDVIGFIRERVGEIEDREEWTGNSDKASTDIEQIEETEQEQEQEQEQVVEEKKPRRGLFGLGRRK